MVRDFQKPTDVGRTLEEEAYMLRNLRTSATFEPSHHQPLTTHPSKFTLFSPCRCCRRPSTLPRRQDVPELWLGDLQQSLPINGGISNLPNVCTATSYSSSSACRPRHALAVFDLLHSLVEPRPNSPDAHPYMLALQGHGGARRSRGAPALPSAPQ